MIKTSSSELEAANKIVPKIDVATGIEKHKEGKSVFIDVRDGLDINKSGKVAEKWNCMMLMETKWRELVKTDLPSSYADFIKLTK